MRYVRARNSLLTRTLDELGLDTLATRDQKHGQAIASVDTDTVCPEVSGRAQATKSFETNLK